MEDIKNFIREEKNLGEDFLKGLKPGELIILCGNGYALDWYCRFFACNGVEPDFIIDKKSHQMRERCGIPVVSYAYIANHMDLEKCKFVVTAPSCREEIMHGIRKEFGNVRIYSFEAEIYCNFIKDIYGYRKFLLTHYEDFCELYELLEDVRSKETLIHFVKGRVSGDQRYFSEIIDPDPYFPDGVLVLGKKEVIVEVGSYDGQTLMDIIERTGGNFEKIYCFEPDRECIPVLEKIVNKSGKQICLIKKGAGSRRDKLYFKSEPAYGTSRTVSKERYDYMIDVTSIDEELHEKVTYIKMDIEGMEMDCLRGGVRTIMEYQPKMAVCVYHHMDDIYEIPRYLRQVNPQYKFYLRHHNWGAADTVLYAI